eukprot:COSAG01_NODE_50959_length_358_cov_12.316602_1_plen_89_part_10
MPSCAEHFALLGELEAAVWSCFFIMLTLRPVPHDSQHAGRRKIPLSAAPTVKFPELKFLLLWSGPDLVSITVNLCYNCTVPRSMQRQDA